MFRNVLIYIFFLIKWCGHHKYSADKVNELETNDENGIIIKSSEMFIVPFLIFLYSWKTWKIHRWKQVNYSS